MDSDLSSSSIPLKLNDIKFLKTQLCLENCEFMVDVVWDLYDSIPINKKKDTKKKKTAVFEIDCSLPVEDNVIVTKDFVKYLTERVKVEGKTANLGDNVTLSTDGSKILVSAHVDFSKRYLKYLTKKYLKKMELREFLRVVASNEKDKKNTYQLKYFKVPNEDEE